MINFRYTDLTEDSGQPWFATHLEYGVLPNGNPMRSRSSCTSSLNYWKLKLVWDELRWLAEAALWRSIGLFLFIFCIQSDDSSCPWCGYDHHGDFEKVQVLDSGTTFDGERSGYWVEYITQCDRCAHKFEIHDSGS